MSCGPGLYAERFSSAGYVVTGIDFSKRSIEYAKKQTLLNKSSIEYHYKNYLTIDYLEKFDVVTLIYCDYAVLSIKERHILLKKVYQALKPNGKFIFDVFTPIMRKKKVVHGITMKMVDFGAKNHISAWNPFINIMMKTIQN